MIFLELREEGSWSIQAIAAANAEVHLCQVDFIVGDLAAVDGYLRLRNCADDNN